MALQDVSDIYFPAYLATSNYFSMRDRTLDAAGEYCSSIFTIPKTGTLKKIGFRTGTVTTADTINVRLETVDPATGYPSGTLYLDESPGSSGSQASPSSNTTYWVALNGTTGVSVTVGDLVAVKVSLDYVDGVLDIAAHTFCGYANMPYTEDYLNSSHNKSPELSNFGLEYNGEIVICKGMMPAIYCNISSTWNTSGYKKGLCFQVPFTCRIRGVVYHADFDNNGEVILYDSDQATAVQTWSIDKDIRGGVLGALYYLYLTTPKTLTINTKYRLVIQPTASGNIAHQMVYTYPDSTISAMAGVEGGVNCYYTECNGTPANEASWTDTVDNRPIAGIIIDQLDDGVSSGGSSPRFGDMTGGLK